jgi:hypothetical protein
MLQRQVKRTEIAPGRVRYRVVIIGEECPPNTVESRVRQAAFLQELADNPSLLFCGYSPFQRLLVTHNGACWQAEAEAEDDEDADV